MILGSCCFAYGRCLAHFAVDPESGLCDDSPGQGHRHTSCPSTRASTGVLATRPSRLRMSGYPTSYLWEETWARDSVLDLVRQFIHEVQEEDERGRKTGQALSSSFPATSNSTACDGWWPTRGRGVRGSVT